VLAVLWIVSAAHRLILALVLALVVALSSWRWAAADRRQRRRWAAAERRAARHMARARSRYAYAAGLQARALSPTAPNPAMQDVGRMPQTIVAIPPGGPFIRYSQLGQQQAYVAAGQIFGGLITLPVPAVSGFIRHFIMKVAATGGTGATVAGANPDAPWNAIANVTIKDPSGQSIYPTIDGFGLFLINLYGGQCGQGGQQDPRNLASFAAVQTTSGSGAGNFTFKIWLPFVINSAEYCALPADNAAETLRLAIQLGTSAAVYQTAPTTLPTMTFTVQEEVDTQPNNLPDLAPFDVGASAQWIVTVSGQNPPSNAFARIQDNNVGQYVHTKIYVYRDSLNVRQDFFPATDLSLLIDNYAYYSAELNDDRYDKMIKAFNITRPTGVIVHTWRQSVMTQVSTADDLEDVLVTSGATKVEVQGTWATNANQPAQLYCYTGFVFPGKSGYPYGSQGA
jgi:hypothetical protein